MISVIICTYNRVKYLEKAIDSVLNQDFSPDLREIIIVDNNSTDGTREFIMNKYSSDLTYLNETRQGLSFCRNTGYAVAKYDYIAFLDDDGVAGPDWLKNMSMIINAGNELFAGATGDVEPIWEKPRPDWLLPEFDIYYSIFRLSDNQFTFTSIDNHTPAGGNVVYKKSILEKYGGFSTELGRTDRKLLSGEETLLNKKIINDGYQLVYSPEIKIRHHIHTSRINRAWLLRRYFWGGYTNSVKDRILLPNYDRTKTSVYLRVLSDIFFNLLLYPLAILLKPKHHAFIYLARATKSLGTLYGSLSI